MFCCTLLYVHSSIAIILMGKRELVALLNLSSWCLVMVERLFLAVPWGCLRFVIVVFPDHTHLLFLNAYNKKIFIYVKMCNADHVCVGIKVNKQAPISTRCASKQYIKIYQIHFWAMNAVVMTFEAKKSVNLISKLG